VSDTNTAGRSGSPLVVAAALVGAPLLIVVLLVVFLGGATPPPCGPGGAGPGSSPGVGPLSANGIPVDLVPLVQQAGTVCPEFPAPVIAAQLKQESGFNQNAVSPSGAEGIAQFMPGTWPSYGVGDPFDPAAAIPAQAKYDCAMAGQISAANASGVLHLTVSITEATLFGYNAGLGAVLASGTGVPTNSQSADYVPLIMGMARGGFSTAGAGSTPAPTAGGGAVQATPAAAVTVPTGCGGGARVLAAGGSGSGGPAAQAAIRAAETQLGLPYVWGGGGDNGPTGGGFDCSGLTSYAFHQVGLDLPRTAQAQYEATAATRLPGGFTPAAYQPGDLLFWGTAGNVHHVAIAIGGGQLIQASTFGEPLNEKPIYESDFFAATRPLGVTPGAPQ